MKKTIIVSGLLFFSFFSCEEKLPPRFVPEGGLRLVEVIASEGSDLAGNYMVTVLIAGQNVYEETFQDTVHVIGQVQIWLDRYPSYTATIPLSSAQIIQPTRMRGRILTIDPDEKFFLQVYWPLRLDDGSNLMDKLEFPESTAGSTVYAPPERIHILVELTLFTHLGFMHYGPVDFIMHPWKKVDLPE